MVSRKPALGGARADWRVSGVLRPELQPPRAGVVSRGTVTRAPMRVAIEAGPLALSSGGLSRYTTELSLALARTFPEDEYFLVSDQDFQMPARAPSNLKRGGGPRNAIERRWWLWGIARE